MSTSTQRSPRETPPVHGGGRRAPRRSLIAYAGIPAFLALPLLGLLPAAEAGPATEADTPGIEDARAPAAPVRATLDPTLVPARRADRSPTHYEAGLAPFSLLVDGDPVDYQVLGVTTLPGATLELTLPEASATKTYELRFAKGDLLQSTSNGWSWRAPVEPGIYPLRVVADGSADAISLNVVALHPDEHVSDGRLHGYRIGQYVQRPLRGDPAYLPPSGFAAVAEEAEDILVSPHFTLGQFLCKQPGEPRFLALSMPLVRKLEAVLAKANEHGIETSTFFVMSGFRTPWYNAAIGNKTVYSRHLWGDAADIFVDVDGDADMDDLNGDGRSDHRDARILADLVEAVEAEGDPGIEPGGIGLYRRASHRGPFVHVDARGSAARW